MDQTTAKASARQLLRRFVARGADTLSFNKSVEAFALPFDEARGLKSRDVVGKTLAFRDLLAMSGPVLATCEILRHPVRKRAFIDLLRPGCIVGSEQDWLVCIGTVFDVSKGELAVVEVNVPVSISQHALYRLFQRGFFHENALPALIEAVTLWSVPILRVLSDEGAELGTEVAIPFSDGLLLGSLEVTSFGVGEGPSITLVSGKGRRRDFLSPAFGKKGVGVLHLAINTYVHRDELYENQEGILDTLDAIQARLIEEMVAVRTALIRGFPDAEAVSRFPSTLTELRRADLEMISTATRMLFASAEWGQHAEAHRRPKRFLN